MPEGAEPAPKRIPAPLALRIGFVLVVLAIALLSWVRWANAANLYPGAMLGDDDARALAAARGDVREVEIVTDDGLTLYGWVLGDAARPRKIIQFMGNGERVGLGADVYAATGDALRAQLLLFNYRGFGESEGRPDEPGLYCDARAVYRFATEDLGWEPSQIIIWGRSLGGGPATKLTSELIEQGQPPAALVLEAPFTNVPDMAREHMGFLARPEWFVYAGYDNLERAPGLTLPVFHFHGTDDEIVPFAYAERLHAALPGPKEFLALSGARHNDVWSDATELRSRIDAFLGKHE
ncbi:MAG: alpha/beta hydrolase [Planctomycetes bacterium]|nr:alpha/beta hydrolase [Planctomycetota bacterium]